MQKFYKIENDINRQVSGGFPQVWDGFLEGTIFANNYISRWQFKKIETDDVVVPKGILDKKAKLTDLLSTSFAGFESNLLVSKKLKDLLVPNSFGIQVIPTEVITKQGEKFDYFILHPYEFANDIFLDEEESIYGVSDYGTNVKKAVFVPDLKYDFFVVRRYLDYELGWFVSEKLKTQIDKLSNSGILLIED